MMTSAFWIDYGYDADHASDGISRYGAYVRNATALFAECWDGTWDSMVHRAARFAADAWQTGTGPVMAPPYICAHPRILSASVGVNNWDGSVFGAVELATGWPAPLAASRDWRSGQWWQTWPVDEFGGSGSYREPGEEELTRGPWLLASARLLFPLPVAGLPEPPDGPRDGLEGKARTAAEALVTAMNTAVAPVIDALERA